jgi:translation initiation factor 3 subunit E
MAEFDLTQRITQFLDIHLALPLLDFLSTRNIYNKQEVLKAEYEMLSSSKMKDTQIDVYKLLHPSEEIPEEILKEKKEILEELKNFEGKCKHVLSIITDEQSFKLAKEKNEFTVEHLGVENVENLIHFAKFQYEIGNYKVSAGYLYDLLELIHKSGPNNPLRSHLPSLAMGKLACEIALGNWEAANNDSNTVRDICLNYAGDDEQNQQLMRAFFMHWYLFVWAFGKGNLDWWINESRIMTVIASQCAYLCRYLVVALCLKRTRKNFINNLKHVVRIIDQQPSTALPNDPITKFASLLIHAQFLEAGEELLRMEPVLLNDFFCHGLANEMINASRSILFEQYTKIHVRISLGSDFPLRKYLFVKNETEEEEQIWVANLLRQRVGGIVACRMDTGNKLLLIAENYPNVYQAVVEQTEANSITRTNQLKINLQSLENLKKTNSAESQ